MNQIDKFLSKFDRVISSKYAYASFPTTTHIYMLKPTGFMPGCREIKWTNQPFRNAYTHAHTRNQVLEFYSIF